MKIWHFCASPVDLDGAAGGVSNVVAALARTAAALGHPVEVVCGTHELGTARAVPGARLEQGVRVRTLDGAPRRRLTLLRALDAAAGEVAPDDIVHLHAGFSLFIDAAAWSLRRRGRRYIVSPHGKLSPGMFNNRRGVKQLWWRAIARRTTNGAARIGLLASGEAALFGELGITAPSVIIPNGYALPADYDPGDPPPLEEPYFVFLGFLDPRKQPELLVRAFAAMRTPGYLLVLAGPDGYGHRAIVEEAVRETALGNRVRFWGRTDGAEKYRLIRHARALCLPSRAEGMPLVLVEAAGVGTPSLFSRESNGDLIRDAGAGIELASFDPAVWTEALDRLAADDALHGRLAADAAELGAELGWDAITERWIAVYRQALAEGMPR